MTNFIKLVSKEAEFETVYVAVDKISHITKHKDHNGAFVFTGSDTGFVWVEESPEEIVKMIEEAVNAIN